MKGERKKNEKPYSGFALLNGEHPFQTAVPGGFVDYAVRPRRGGKLFYFNFDLAEEIGLIPTGSGDQMNKELNQTILETFSLQIINEYDIAHQVKVPEEEVRPHRYMATRYLQLQHPDKKGLTSGDGRSIWNGSFNGPRGHWDISSCGVGVTCLSPATAIEKRYFKTGNKFASYGGGRLDLLDGVSAALMSDIFYRNQIRTERTLAVIAYEDGTCVNVRAGKNLLRPAHFFVHLKQGDHTGLKQAVDYYIARQVENNEWPLIQNERKKYRDMLERFTVAFAGAAARFESEYIFCWMEWDGDNILADGGIIDYGSVRQFGLFHHEYRYEDVDRLSTTITEQKNKAKYLVQTFAQMTEFLINGKKKNLKRFKDHRSMKHFERSFEWTKDQAVLHRVGLNRKAQTLLMNTGSDRKAVRAFRTILRYFENVKTRRGRHAVADGFNWDAAFCVRDILRELPASYLSDLKTVPPKQFIDIMRSHYASEADARIGRSRREKVTRFQRLYRRLVHRAAQVTDRPADDILREIKERSALINRYGRVTGDSILRVCLRMIREWNKSSIDDLHQMFRSFVEEQILQPEGRSAAAGHALAEKNRNETKDGKMKLKNGKTEALRAMLKIVKKYREGL